MIARAAIDVAARSITNVAATVLQGIVAYQSLGKFAA